MTGHLKKGNIMHVSASGDRQRAKVKILNSKGIDNVGCLLRGIDRDAVERGQVLARPGSTKAHRKLRAEVYVLTKEEGGRHTPFFRNYSPQFYFRTTDVTGKVELADGSEMVQFTVESTSPSRWRSTPASPSAKAAHHRRRRGDADRGLGTARL